MSYDIRVVRLIKSTKNNPLQNYLSPSNEHKSTFICLGHFDIMVIDKLDVRNNETPLAAVQSDSQCFWTYTKDSAGDEDILFKRALENNYLYPLYAIKQFIGVPNESDEGEEAHQADVFWNIASNYTVVTRLHCEREAGAEKMPFSQILTDRLKSLYTDSCEEMPAYLYLSNVDGDNFPVNVTFYDSLELGDIVGFIKCDSLATILKIQRDLYETPCVSDAYTYCGINNTIYQEQTKPNQAELLQNRVLEYISTRFSVKQAKYAEMIYPVLLGDEYLASDQHFFVTGNADAIIDWRNCNEIFFLSRIEKLIRIDEYVKEKYGEDKCDKVLYNAFNDIITRVGIKHCSPRNSREFDFTKEGNTNIECLNFLKSGNADGQVSVRWKYPLIKLLGTLQTMSQNCVMDDLSNLLIPGVNAILNRIMYYLKKKKQINEAELLSFLDSCTSLTNDILHLENQLVQHPELMPVRYFIPAIVLGYEQKFINQCAFCIERLDRAQPIPEECRRFQPIIFPSREKNISTQCYLDHKTDNDYQEDTPLGIFVPIHYLYQPWEVLHMLCHEIAHYCGDKLREREFRLDCITASAAEYVLQLWDMYCHFQYSPDKADVVVQTRSLLAQAIYKMYQNSRGKGSPYLADIQHYVPVCTVRVAADRGLQEKYQNAFLKESTMVEQLSFISTLDTMNSMYGGVSIYELFSAHLRSCLLSHYKECYADIMMILFLECKFDDYYNCVYAQECSNFLEKDPHAPSNDVDKSWWEYHTDRLAFVCTTICNLEKYGNWVKDYDCTTDTPSAVWAKVGINKMKQWKQRDKSMPKWYREYIPDAKSNPYFICAYEAEELLNYLNRCANNIVQKVENDVDIINLRTQLKKLNATNFDWSCIRDYV